MAFVAVCMSSTALALPVKVVYEAMKGSFTLAADGKAAIVIVDNDDAEVVKVAAEMFCDDIEMVSGAKPVLSVATTVVDGSRPVLVGTIGRSLWIDRFVKTGKIDVSNVKGKWETFGIAVVDKPFKGIPQALVVYGSDPRGTSYGLMELSRMMGVSPWCWWADVTPRKHETVCVTRGAAVTGPPSVKYRGLFINDEDWGLQPWAAKHLDKDVNDLGPRTYEQVMRLMLRLKANLLWPAMHPCTKAFWYYKENPELARKYDIVLGSSHCEQMLRNNVDEWVHNFPFEFGRLPGPYDWKNNRKTVEMYWGKRVKESKDNDAIYTLGMRGIHDSGMPGYNTDEERRDALEEIITEQRNMIERDLGRPAADVPQIFCPYKEALKPYRLGMQLPGDVTLVWADDNHGFMRQLSKPEEQRRKGGGGVYYHLSYWGVPQDYLWLGSTPPALIAYELSKAYAMNCKDVWVFNVGDIKPIEYEAQFAFDFAWNVNSVDVSDADIYGKRWGAETFGADVADAVCAVKREYYNLASAGKPEHVAFVKYSKDEMNERIGRYAALEKTVDSLQTHIAHDLQDAYYELIAYSVKAARAMNAKVLGSRLSFIYAALGDKTSAMKYSEISRKGYEKIQNLTEKYNKETAKGKWDGMMDYAPRGLRHFYAFKTATEADVAASRTAGDSSCDSTVIAAVKYAKADKRLKTLHGLGTSGAVLTVWPVSTKSYGGNPAQAPYAEYKVRVSQGENVIRLKFLPTFPLFHSSDLRYAMSVDGSEPQIASIKREAETGEWGDTVMQGYVERTTAFTSDRDKTATVRIYFVDPSLALSSLTVTGC